MAVFINTTLAHAQENPPSLRPVVRNLSGLRLGPLRHSRFSFTEKFAPGHGALMRARRLLIVHFKYPFGEILPRKKTSLVIAHGYRSLYYGSWAKGLNKCGSVDYATIPQ